MEINHLSLLILLPSIVSACKHQPPDEQINLTPVDVQTTVSVEKNSPFQAGNAYVIFSKKSIAKEQLNNCNTQLIKVKSSKA